MRELEALRRYVRHHARLIAARVTRLHDAMHTLATLVEHALGADLDPERARATLDERGFTATDDGFFERPALLERLAGGDACQGALRFYVRREASDAFEILRRVAALEPLGDAVGALKERLGDLAWIYYIDRTGFAATYPYHVPIVPADFAWRDYLTYRLAAPAANPARAIVWTPPNVDYGGKGVTLAPCIPVFRGERFEGVFAIDVPMSLLVGDALRDPITEGQVSFIVDRAGYLVAHPTIEVALRGEHGAIAREPLMSLGGALGALDVAALYAAGEAVMEVGEGEAGQRVVSAAIPEMGWLLVSSFPLRSLQARRAEAVRVALEAMKHGDMSVRVGASSDALGEIAHAFNETAAALAANTAARERAMAELERSRQEVRALFDASPTAMALFDDAGRLVDHNRACAPLLDGMRAPPPALATLLVHAHRDGHAGPVEYEVSSDAGTHFVCTTARRITRHDGVHVLCASEDLTERRAFEARLIEAQKLRVIGRLAAGIAHDFNNLLTAIGTSAHLLRQGEVLEDGEPDELLGTIIDATDRAGALTSQLLSFARRDVVDRRVVDLGEVLRESLRLVRRVVSSDVQLSLEIAADLPHVEIDRGQLAQIVLNLVVNARDALPVRGGHIAIVAQRTEDGAAKLTVSDSGRGMDAATLARATEPFFTTKATGTGLGLSTVKDIVEAAGGAFTLSSVPGDGTRASLTLPATRAKKTVRTARPRVSAEGRVVIALVDDDDLVRNATERGLRHLGYEVRAFGTSEDALRLLEDREAPVSLLLTDVVMPGLNGRELADAARRARPGLPVIFLSGYTDDAILQHGIEARTVNLLRKPFRPESLAEAVRAAL